MYCVDRIYVKPAAPAFAYLDGIAHKAKFLYNAALFRLRNHFTARNKASLTDNEQLVENELALLAKKPRAVISASQLQNLMVLTHNPDYYSGIPSQTAQHIVAQAVADFHNWLSALKVWKKDPSGFMGKPAMPRYKKKDITGFLFTSQGAVIRDGQITFPKTDVSVRCRMKPGTLKEVRVTPYHEGYLLSVCMNVPDVQKASGTHAAAIDFGVDNIMSVVADGGKSLIFRGGAVKSENRFFNKEKARLTAIITKGRKTTSRVSSHRMETLSRHRQEFLHDVFQKMSSRLMEWCLAHNIGILVLGSNRGWKQNSSLGRTNNQTFISIPFDRLKQMIRYKAERLGITVVEQEESYTSKASFIDGDTIPVYQGSSVNTLFSGRRIQRGLYKSKDGTVVNADLNAAANILRKAGYDTTQVSVARMKSPLVLGYRELNTRIPVIGISAA